MSLAKPGAVLVACALLIPLLGAGDPEDGVSVVDCFSGEIDVVQQSADTFWASWRHTGTRRATHPGGAFDRMSGRCTGIVWARNGVFRGHGGCEFVDGDGDKLFMDSDRRGDKASWEFTGGTGKYAGVTGSGRYLDFSYFPRLSPTTYQFCPTSTGRYKRRPETG